MRGGLKGWVPEELVPPHPSSKRAERVSEKKKKKKLPGPPTFRFALLVMRVVR